MSVPQGNEDIWQERKRSSSKGTKAMTCKKVFFIDSNQGTVKDEKRQSTTSINALGREERWNNRRSNGV